MKLYKLLHFIFGWDYIHWNNTADEGIARLHMDGNMGVFYWRYSLTKFLDKINSKDQVTWLTCPASKYLKEL